MVIVDVRFTALRVVLAFLRCVPGHGIECAQIKGQGVSSVIDAINLVSVMYIRHVDIARSPSALAILLYDFAARDFTCDFWPVKASPDNVMTLPYRISGDKTYHRHEKKQSLYCNNHFYVFQRSSLKV